ncbi:hypothetical protein [Microscilla marina]|nr:hypothetical protein [Microscilla marina]
MSTYSLELCQAALKNNHYMVTSPLLKLTEHERKVIADIFFEYTLHEFYYDEHHQRQKKFMRQRAIWINDEQFLEKNKKKKSIQSLVNKKIIVKHLVGYRLFIRPEYLDQLYDLADTAESENHDLILQLTSVWVEPQA